MRSVLLAVIVVILASASVARAHITITQGGTWLIDTRVKVTACAQGQCERDGDQTSDEVFLSAGSIVKIVLIIGSCDEIPIGDYCEFLPRPNNKVKIGRCDKSILGALLQDCSPYPNTRLRRIGGFEKVAPDGQSFRAKLTAVFTLRVSGVPVTLTVNVLADGTLIAPGLVTGELEPVTLDLAPLTPGLVESVVDGVLRR